MAITAGLLLRVKARDIEQSATSVMVIVIVVVVKSPFPELSVIYVLGEQTNCGSRTPLLGISLDEGNVKLTRTVSV